VGAGRVGRGGARVVRAVAATGEATAALGEDEPGALVRDHVDPGSRRWHARPRLDDVLAPVGRESPKGGRLLEAIGPRRAGRGERSRARRGTGPRGRERVGDGPREVPRGRT